jgi:hypothetical protein
VKYFLAIFFVFLLLKSEAQILYKTRYRKAIFAETFATSPIFSVNYEYLPFRWQRAFLSTRIGIGYVPGATDQGVSFPVAVTYNFLANNLRGKVFRRVNNRCNPNPPRIENETFIEAGAGYTFVAYSRGETRNFSFGIIGLRTQVVFNIPPHPRTVFLRLVFTPAYVIGEFEPRGGVGLGVSL